MHLSHSHSHDSNWEVVDQKQVPQVQAYYDESVVQITSISSEDVAHTYTFDAPSASSSPRSPFKLLKAPGSPKGFRLSRSPSPSGSDESYPSDYSPSSDYYDSNLLRDPRDFTPSQARDALISARTQFLASSDIRKMGANVLFTEGWVITKLRKGSKFRLQVQYTARPAKAAIATKSIPLSLPPFMDLLEGSW